MQMTLTFKFAGQDYVAVCQNSGNVHLIKCYGARTIGRYLLHWPNKTPEELHASLTRRLHEISKLKHAQSATAKK